MKNKKRKVINKVCIFFSIISIILTVVFFVYLINLNMIPNKYLIMLGSIIGIIYILMLLLIIPKKIKVSLKITCTLIMFIISGILFYSGVVYVDKLINFLDKIDNSIVQKDTYYIVVLESSRIDSIDGLKDKKIGYYNSNSSKSNNEKALNLLNTKITYGKVEYKDIEEMLDDLSDNVIEGLLLNESVYSLINSDLSYLGIKVKKIDTLHVLVETTDIVKYVDVTNTPFNLYIAGGDAYGSIGYVTNTDVNMVATIDPVNNRILLTSIPRDYYVELPGKGAKDKLTHAGYYGIESSVKAVEDLLDIEVNYYAKVNFSTVEKVIDAIGGVDIYNEFEFTESAFHKYTFNQGDLHLNGNQALAYARERKSFSTGDVQRVKNQQKILTAVIKKMTSSTTLITSYSKILDSISDNFNTNLDNKSMAKLVKKQLNNMKGWTIESQNLTGYDYYTYDTYTYPNLELYVMKQNDESVNNARKKIKEFMK